MRGARDVGLWRRVQGRWSILSRLLLVGYTIQRFLCAIFLEWVSMLIIGGGIHEADKRSIVIVRRVVAARKAQAATMTPANVQTANGLFGHGHSSSATQPLSSFGNKEAADVTDFPERPGARRTKRGGFWARFKCW